MVKAILGYDIEPHLSEEEYDRWLREVHLPDLMKIPGLKRVVLNTVKDVLREGDRFYRIAELHYDSWDDFERASEWRRQNPVTPERSPEGKTAFRFYVVCESEAIPVEAKPEPLPVD
jgi:hypothetical protein